MRRIILLFSLSVGIPFIIVSMPLEAGIRLLSKKQFVINILEGSFSDLGLGYTWEQAWPILRTAYLRSASRQWTLEDIEAYQWNSQTFRLTARASKEFMANFPKKSSLYKLDHRAFVVMHDDMPAFGGLFLERGSAMAIRYPVFYIDEAADGTISLTLRPYHTIAEMPPLSDSSWDPIGLDKLRSIFDKERKLVF
jgi:hypothetical protein